VEFNRFLPCALVALAVGVCGSGCRYDRNRVPAMERETVSSNAVQSDSAAGDRDAGLRDSGRGERSVDLPSAGDGAAVNDAHASGAPGPLTSLDGGATGINTAAVPVGADDAAGDAGDAGDASPSIDCELTNTCPCPERQVRIEGECAPIDRCQPDAGDCAPPARCEPKESGNRCVCDPFYRDAEGDGTSCVDFRVLSIDDFGGAARNLGYSLAVAPDGDVILGGAFQTSIVFGSTRHTAQHTGEHDYDAYVTRFDPALNTRWSQRFGASRNDRVYRVAVDAAGDVFVIGVFQLSVRFGAVLLTANSWSSFVAKLDGADGTVIWVRALPGTFAMEPLDGWVYDVAVDADGNSFVAGRFDAPFDFGVGAQPLMPTGFADAFVIKYDPDGVASWVHTWPSEDKTAATGLAVDSRGAVIVTGMVQGEGEFDRGAAAYGDADGFLAKLAGNGEEIWSLRFGSSGFDYGYTLTTVGEDVLLAGIYEGELYFDGETLPPATERGIFVARLEDNGLPIWLREIDAEDSIVDVHSITATPDSFVISGDYASTLSFRGGIELTVTPSAAADVPYNDMFVARFALDGTPLWAHSWGGTDYDEALDVVVDSEGKLLVTGWYGGPVRFGSTIKPSTGRLSVPLLRLEP
jgi:hypothetical protein